MTARPRVLVVEHEADDPPALVGLWLEEAGCALHVCSPWAGDELPADLASYDGLLVMGGWMSAHSDAEVAWLAGVKELTKEAARDDIPMLGICLGHQVAAVALGGSVEPNPAGQQVGMLEVRWLPAAAEDPLVGQLATGTRAADARGVHWNRDVVTRLPEGAEALAQTAGGELQAARLARTVWGVQWHPEVGEELVRRWAQDDLESVLRLGIDLEATLAAIDGAREELDAAWRPLATRFAGLVADHAAAPRTGEPRTGEPRTGEPRTGEPGRGIRSA